MGCFCDYLTAHSRKMSLRRLQDPHSGDSFLPELFYQIMDAFGIEILGCLLKIPRYEHPDELLTGQRKARSKIDIPDY